MMDCECLIHPFQNDTGTSQQQRVMEHLLSGAAKIDARTLADLLDYFVQMSRHINYYDFQLNVNDWQPFFSNSIPFSLASIIKFPMQDTSTSLDLNQFIFNKRPSAAGLQILAYSIYYRFIYKINNWQILLKDSSLPMAATMDGLIKNKLQDPVKQLVKFINAGVKTYGVKRIDFLKLSANEVWGLDAVSINAVDTSFSDGTFSDHQRLLNLYGNLSALLPVFTDAIKTLSAAAENNLELSFIPLQAALQKKHSPHLALLFAFLNMFRQLQNDLNQYTRKHLDYFYRDILKFQPAAAIPDKANIVFEIQKALKSYLLKKGLLVKDGKDNNSQDILFSLQDDILVTQTTIADRRTLFLNNQQVHAQTYVEGVYMAPVAQMADGVSIPFATDPKNIFTLGAHQSKYADPETKLLKPFPNARLGFVLASQVLLLQGGSSRKIVIQLPCVLKKSLCSNSDLSNAGTTQDCCNNSGGVNSGSNGYPDFIPSDKFYEAVNDILANEYCYINEDIIKDAQKKGMGAKLATTFRTLFLVQTDAAICYCPQETKLFETILTLSDFKTALNKNDTGGQPFFTAGEKEILEQLIVPRRAFSLLLSGEKGWLKPASVDKLELQPDPLSAFDPSKEGYPFTLYMECTLQPDQDGVTFYDKDLFGEDFGETNPLIKIELDDKIKFKSDLLKKIEPDPTTGNGCCTQDPDCCFLVDEKLLDISLYNLFRNVVIDNVVRPTPPTPEISVITVKVCGLKNFIVQNDENVMNVNNLVYPFGARPKIDANFYIGSEEVFLKKWTDINLNLNWKNKPADFTAYYNGYQDYFINSGTSANVIDGNDFRIKLSILQDGNWIPWANAEKCNTVVAVTDKSYLFQPYTAPGYCSSEAFDNQFSIDRKLDFGTSLDAPLEAIQFEGYKRLDVNTRHSFIKISLKCQDFQHDKYSFVLARQMAALGKLPELVDGAVYFGVVSGTMEVLDIPKILKDIIDNADLSSFPDIRTAVQDLIKNINDLAGASPGGQITDQIWGDLFISNDPVTNLPPQNLSHSKFTFPPNVYEHSDLYANLNKILTWLQATSAIVKNIKDWGVVIPKEPWTPTISNMALDYTAFAALEDINLIHLYPFEGTHKREEIESQPTLFPLFCDEGTLFLGLKDLVPGDNLNILFQLAEATSDSESDKEEVFWHYLDGNTWKDLRPGFEVLNDATQNLTSSGIIQLALPANMSNNNTVMPDKLYWIKASIPKNSGSVSETIDVLTQAVEVVFTNTDANDKLRLSQPLKAGSISKLNEADAAVKTVTQPFESFGGQVPEIEQQFYIRVSETLRHKGRAIQAFDYERLVLQAFPQVFKAKCINHSFALNAHEYKNDFPYAPGYIILAVIPDLNLLKAGNSFQPRVPVSTIESINAFIRKRSSPFVRFRAMNPRYEKIDFCITLRLVKGKDENYYKEKVKEDLSTFLAPWAVGEYSKLSFGQCIYRSDIIQFFETRDYVDFLLDLRMGREGITPDVNLASICPITPRSILIAGNIEVCINPPDCENWSDYYSCDKKNPITGCNNKPEIIIDYCK